MLTVAAILKSIADDPIVSDYSITNELIRVFLDGIQNFEDGNNDRFNKRFGVKVIRQWICTDTHVGFYALYLDGDFVGFGFQPFRKSHTEFEWVSETVGASVCNWVKINFESPVEVYYAVIAPEDDYADRIEFCDAQTAESIKAREETARRWRERQAKA